MPADLSELTSAVFCATVLHSYMQYTLFLAMVLLGLCLIWFSAYFCSFFNGNQFLFCFWLVFLCGLSVVFCAWLSV